MHTYKPASVDDERLAVVAYALEVPQDGERVEADINASRGAGLGDLASDIRLYLGRGSTAEDVLPRLDGLTRERAIPRQADLGVRAADGSGLTGSRGLPRRRDRAEWQALNGIAFSGSYRVDYGPYQIYTSLDQFGIADVAIKVPHPARDSTHRQIAGLMRAHLARLQEHSDHFVYRVTVNGEETMWFSSRTCDLDGFPAWQARVIRDYFRSIHRCAAERS